MGPGIDSQFKARDPLDVDKALPEAESCLLHVGARARVQVVQCIFEEPMDANLGCGIIVDEGGRLEAVDSVVRDFEEYGLVTYGVSKLARCRITGSKVGARMVDDHPTLDKVGAQLILKGCILQNNREMGVYLPPVCNFLLADGRGKPEDESSWSFRCVLQGSTISRSWYPVAQKTASDTHWERYPWVETLEDLVGFRMDERSQLQELAEADYDRSLDDEDDQAPSRCPSSIALSDGEKYWCIQDDWEYHHGDMPPAPPRSKQSTKEPVQLPKGSKRHHGPVW